MLATAVNPRNAEESSTGWTWCTSTDREFSFGLGQDSQDEHSRKNHHGVEKFGLSLGSHTCRDARNIPCYIHNFVFHHIYSVLFTLTSLLQQLMKPNGV